MGKLAYILLGAILVIAIIAGVAYFKIVKSPTTTAFLNIESGTVEINTGKGWQAAADQMKLGLSDRIRTGEGAEASIVLYESIIVSLEPSTEIGIKDLDQKNIKLEQPAGKTWNKFTELAGVEEFSVETPTTVATVRGTEFGIEMDGIEVGEGEVEAKAGGESFRIRAGKKILKKEGKFIEEDMTPEEKQRAIAKMKKTLEIMKKLRMRELEKKRFLYSKLKQRYGLTDEQVKEYLNRADRGEFDLDEIERKSPVKIENVRKIKAITEKIREQNRIIEELKRKYGQ